MPSTPSRTALAPVATVAAAGLALAACTAEPPGDDLAGPSPTASEAPSSPSSPLPDPDPTATEQPPVMPGIDVPDLTAQCFAEPGTPQVDRITYSVPSEWRVEGRCDVLDPELEELPEEGQDVSAAIFVDVSPVPFSEFREDSPARTDVTTWLGARAGYQALRQTSTSTGEALGPEGRPTTTWAYDLDAGTDDDGGVFTISTGDADDHEFVSAVADAIAQTVVIQPPAVGDPAPETFAVVRTEGGGTPYTVTYDGDCFALRPGGPDDGPTDQQCGLDPTQGPIVAGTLGEDDRVVVGYAPPTSIAVSADVPAPYGLTANIEGGSVFAFEVSEAPSQLTALGPGGEELVTVAAG